jgi:HEAT repeat protein
MQTTRQFTLASAFLAALVFLAFTSTWADDAATAATEKELLAVLRSDKPAADKAIACKRLAIYGSSESVPDLAKLLFDPRLASWARIALEAIPGRAADEALRRASESLEGNLLVGTINSIGVRRDAGAVEGLVARLQDKDAEVASAAAVALGRIGNAAAAKSLRGMLATASVKIRSAVAEGCVLCAEQLHSEGKPAEAAAIYDEVRKAQVPKQRIIEATRGAILARKEAGLPLLLEQLHSPDKRLFNLALSTAREFPGGEIDKALAAEIAAAEFARANPERGALIVHAMADRKETVVVSALEKAAGGGAKPIRLAAIGALGRVGDASCLSILLGTAGDSDADVARAAKTALADLEGEKVDAQITVLLAGAQGKTYPLLIELVGQRRIKEATPSLLKALGSSDKTVRSAALLALGETVALQDLSVLISQVVSPKNADDAAVAQQALKNASVRMPDREACATELAMAVDRAPADAKIPLLDILGDVGGEKALRTLAAAAKSNDPQLQNAGSRILGKWNSLDASPVLLDLAKTGPAPQYRVRALRGYIGLARRFAMPDGQRAEMCQRALDTAKQVAEQKLVLEVLKIHPSKETLNLAIKAIQNPALKEDATQATLVIAQKLGGKGIDVSDLVAKAGLGKVKLEIVKAVYGSGSTQKDVTSILQKHAGDLQLISLPAATYNEAFGGDPAAGAVKQLKVQYRINGKPSETTFAENALIILPMPK